MNPYVDLATGTHHNKLGITDRAQLREVEYRVTDVRIAELRLQPIEGNFDLDHLRKIHRHIFGDLYEWAGKERTRNFSKPDPLEPWWKSVFARHEHIPLIAGVVADDLREWKNLKGLGSDDFATKLAAIYIKVNHMHPFPEGNGRSTQTYMSQLAREAGYSLAFDKLDPKLWNAAAARSMPQVSVSDPAVKRPQNPAYIREVFRQIVSPMRQRDTGRELGDR
ncbi:MAG: Fic family protein [Burkholderiales bacterium]|nr:Fic family protein [Burkholderiales bacterium]